jgi:hypothetical protein
MTASPYRKIVIAAVLALGGIGCGSQPVASNKPAAANTSAPPPPPPSQAAKQPAPGPASGDVPVWAGQSSGEPFDVKQFLSSRSAPADNAAPLYESALARISGELGGDKVAALDQRIGELANIDRYLSGAIEAAELEQTLAAAAPAMKMLDAAQTRPACVFVTGLSADTLLPHAQASRTATRCCLLQVFHARTTGDFALAEAAIRRGLRLSRDLRPRGHFVCQLVSIANDGMLLSAIERVTLADPNLTPEQCDRLLALLMEHQHQGIDCYDEGMRMDYLLARGSIHDIQTGRLTLGQILELLSSGPLGAETELNPPMNFPAEIAACNNLYALALDAPNSPVATPEEFAEFRRTIAAYKRDWDSFMAKLKATPPANRPSLRPQMPAMQFHSWTAGLEAGRQSSRRIMTNLAGLQMLIALRRYELVNRRIPNALVEAATATTLKSVPIDPYSGQPLRFAQVDCRATIYSVGNDFKDDGGRMDWKHGTQPGDYLFVLSPLSGTR